MGRIAEEEREKLQVRLDKIEQTFYINSRDFIPKSRKCECTNGAQTLVVWAFSNFVENLRTSISKALSEESVLKDIHIRKNQST